MENSFVLRGDICYSKSPTTLGLLRDSYLVCENGVSKGVFDDIPEGYRNLPVKNHQGKLIIPGLTDLHMHAPQYAFRALGMDLELLDWLNTRTFPEEAKYHDIDYARTAYEMLVQDLKAGPNTRICLFATIHTPATIMLMEMLEQSGLVTMVGRVNMDRNGGENLCESCSTDASRDTRDWLRSVAGRFKNTSPILTPRFVPCCTDELMDDLAAIQREFKLPLQSHLSENQSEIAWVKELCPESTCYGDAYLRHGLFGGEVPTIMAHCTWSGVEEMQLMGSQGVFVAHCPQSNMNLSSGIAPVRRFLSHGLRVGLGSDMAGGSHSSIFRAMSDAIQVSKLHWRLRNQSEAALTVEEVFWLGTVGGGAFFGKVGSFDDGYEFDALVLDDSSLRAPFPLDLAERLARVIYLSDDRHIEEKYVRGALVS